MSTATAGCPRGARCESCGREHRHLMVCETTTRAGLVCLTLCPGCAQAIGGGVEAPITVATAGRLADQHREHLAAGGAAKSGSASEP